MIGWKYRRHSFGDPSAHGSHRYAVACALVAATAWGAVVAGPTEDFADRLEQAGRLFERGDVDRAAELLEPLITGDEFGLQAPDLRGRALIRLARIIDAQCSRLESRGRSALQTGDLTTARGLFQALAARREASPYLSMTAERLGLAGGPINRRVYDFMRRVESALRDSAIAWQAYVDWRAGDESSAEHRLSGSGGRQAFSTLVAGHAYDLFEAKQWAESAAAYAVAIEQRIEAGSARYDEETGRLTYNRAMAEFGAGRLQTCLHLLRQLRTELPQFRRDEVARALADIERLIESSDR